ncbi:MAG: hypothetical protein NT121_22660 [Chloroflexi bacterium]|nr:hypothetical protein [Chloroflexota bacterium]
MSTHSTHSSRFHLLRRLWKPVAVTGAGGTAIAYWLEDIAMFGEEILALIFLPILAGTIYLLDILIFKSRMPRREDMTSGSDLERQGKPTDTGAKK